LIEEERMESVMEQIKQARQTKKKNTETFPAETIIDGCHVTMRFDSVGDHKVFNTIRSMLISAHTEAILVPASGGGQS